MINTDAIKNFSFLSSTKCYSDKLLALFLFGFAMIYAVFPALWYQSILQDSAQNISWGHVWAWSYNRHPPLGVWFIQLFKLFLNNEAATFFASVLCLSISLVFIYKLSRKYLEQNLALVATVLSTLSLYYLSNFVLEYNQNTIMLPFWVLVCYMFDKCLAHNLRRDWIQLGIFSAASLLAKYESLVILFVLFAYFFWHFDRKYLFNFCIAFIIGALLLTPHLVSVAHHGFLPIKFLFSRIEETSRHGWTYYHLVLPLVAFLEQVGHIGPAVTGLALMYQFKRVVPLEKRQKLSVNYLVWLGFAPLLTVLLIAFIGGIKIHTEWGYPLFSFLIPGLVAYKKVSLNECNLKRFVAMILCIHLSVLLVLELSSYFATRGVHSSHPSVPGYSLAAEAQKFWAENTCKPLKIIGGEEPIDYFLAAYLPSRPLLFEDFSLEKSIWLNRAQLKRDGALIVLNGCDADKNKAIQSRWNVQNTRCIHLSVLKKHHPVQADYSLMMMRPIPD